MNTACKNRDKDQNVGQTERVFSGMAGLALIAMGLQRRSLGGLVIAALGGAAIQRGVSGKCAVYKAFNISTAEQPMNRAEDIKIDETISIRRPVADQVGGLLSAGQERLEGRLSAGPDVGRSRFPW